MDTQMLHLYALVKDGRGCAKGSKGDMTSKN